jgi:hypothetical protein
MPWPWKASVDRSAEGTMHLTEIMAIARRGLAPHASIHDLKTDPTPLRAVKRGEKRAEYRADDRRFEVGDRLVLRGHDRTCNRCFLEIPIGATANPCRSTGRTCVARGYTGDFAIARITHIARGPYVPTGFAMLSIEVLG